ncbi:response regulator transcription factor [Syntrophomonas erecta]
MSRILVVDDEKSLVKGLVHAFTQEGHEAVGVYDGITALEEARKGIYDLMILDLMLPGIDGFSLCRKIRQDSGLPIIMLTARGDDLDKIAGLEIGADDYLAKPFNIRELIARVHSVLRRTTPRPAKIIRYDDFVLNLDQRTLKKGGKYLEVTSKEFDLLTVCMSEPGRVFTRGQLLDAIWSLDIADERTVDVNIRRLREKIESDPRKPVYLLTRWGVGYYWRELV